MEARADRGKTKRTYRGTGYWVLQIGACAVIGLACLAAGGFLLFAPDSVTCPAGGCDDNAGGGLLVLLIGIGLIITMVVVIRLFVRSTKEQRAVYAWAIMQQYWADGPAGPLNVPTGVAQDARTLQVAAQARRGELSRKEIDRLQALRPDVPYPGRLPSYFEDGKRT
ncbi:hypothetical protein FOE78_21905 [Microlunatus elymi]|uniref:Uncharacterized protein n=1 Tax=Microlunatus elymi TaxID=2596828 RepID=A0A516Q4A2_9ACTN|nr:hypothetical protein [Microlunatus elymi]QDP98202.1 hypothetical protein FOE78_21905 [Microlunatus elymi]